MDIKNYRDLEVWRKAVDLVDFVYTLTESFPKEQQYILTSQIQRSAISIPSNIAEGRSRHSRKDFILHLNIARGSLAELETQMIIASRRSYIDETTLNISFQKTNEIGRMLHGLINSLKRLEYSPTETRNLKPETIS